MRRILTILSFILLTTIASQGQSLRETSPTNVVDRIVRLYPNPATAYIIFDMQKGYEKGLSLQVFNFLGKRMFESQNIAEKTTIDLADYTRGVYVYHLRDQSGKIIESGKFQVSK